jgi:hypothetical protein
VLTLLLAVAAALPASGSIAFLPITPDATAHQIVPNAPSCPRQGNHIEPISQSMRDSNQLVPQLTWLAIS